MNRGRMRASFSALHSISPGSISLGSNSPGSISPDSPAWCSPARWARAVGLVVLSTGLAAPRCSGGEGTATPPVGEWRYYAHDPGSTKYTPLTQINRDNVGKLAVAWTWDSPYVAMRKKDRMLTSFAYEDTPLMVGGTLYATSSLCHVAAIDAATGKEKWVFDPKSYEAGRPGNLGFVNRGVAYWTDGTLERIYIATHDAHLWAIDVKTGKAVTEFGEGGKVDLSKSHSARGRARSST